VWSKVPRNLTENYLSSLLQLAVVTLSESVGSRGSGELKEISLEFNHSVDSTILWGAVLFFNIKYLRLAPNIF
jgi:hypothetical protein